MPFISILQWDVSESFFYAFEDVVGNGCANISNIIILSLNDTTRVKCGFKQCRNILNDVGTD